MGKIRELLEINFISGAEFDTHYHQNLEIIYVIKGEMKIQIDDSSYRLKGGDYILINANKRHSIVADELFGARFLIDFHLLAEYLGTIQLMFWCNTIADKNDAYDDLRKVLDKILRWNFEKEGNAGNLYLNALEFEAVYILTTNFMVKADDARVAADSSQDRIRINQIQNYIQANYQSDISLNDLADKLFLSNTYLSKYIKKHIGLTFGAYLSNVRLFHAVDELLYSNKNLTHIALDNGFANSAAFTKAFRQVHGMTPSKYRREMKISKKIQNKNAPKETGQYWILEYLEYREKQEAVVIENESIIETDVKKYCSRNRLYNKAVNVGEAFLLLQSEVQNQIREIHRETGVVYARIWNLLSEQYEMDEGEGYNFRKIDLVLDFIVDNNMKPYIELGYKPSLFMYTPERILMAQKKAGNLCEIGKFSKIIQTLFLHLVNRYGLDEVEEWILEFWNDPKLHIGSENGQYYDYFEKIHSIVKSISPQIKVGGAGFILGYETPICRKVFEIWEKRNMKPDFLSFCSFQYISVVEDNEIYGQKSIDGHYMQHQIEIIRTLMEAVMFDIEEVHVNEWNFTVSNRNVLNDSCGQGAYIIMNCINMEDRVDFMAYWHGLDVYSDYYDSDSILNGDSGIISRDGIRKPSFYAFQFLNKLQSNIIVKDEHSIITTNGRGRYTIVCHNYKKLSAKYVFAEEDRIKIEEQDLYMEDTEPLKLKFRLDNVEKGNYLIKISYINPMVGNVQGIWEKLDFAKRLSQEEIEYLKKKAIPSIEMKMIHVSSGILEIESILEAQEIRMIDVQFRYGQD